MKRTISMLLSVIMLCGILSACGSDTGTNQTPSASPSSAVETSQNPASESPTSEPPATARTDCDGGEPKRGL